MRTRFWFSIAVLMVIIAIFIWLPLLNASAEGNTQTIQATIDAVVCTPFSPTNPNPFAEQSRLICDPPWERCIYSDDSRSHTFDLPPGSHVSVEARITSWFLYCSYMTDFEAPPPTICAEPVMLGWSYFATTCIVPPSGQLTFTVFAHGRIGYNLTVTELEPPEPPTSEPPIIEPPLVATPDPEILAGVQRINQWSAIPYIVYVPTAERSARENTPFIDIWHLDENGVGQPLLSISKEQLLTLPATPAENLLLATSPTGIVNIYKLTTGEYQVNIGPLEDGKVYTTIFDAVPPTIVRHSTSVVLPQ